MADQALAIQEDPANGGGIHPAQQLPGWGQGAVHASSTPPGGHSKADMWAGKHS